MNGIREELESIRETSQTQRKRFLDMLLVVLRDVGDVGTILGGSMNEQKKPTIENLDQAEEEFTLARLYLSKLKTETRSITTVSSTNSIFIYFDFFVAFERIGNGKNRSSEMSQFERQRIR